MDRDPSDHADPRGLFFSEAVGSRAPLLEGSDKAGHRGLGVLDQLREAQRRLAQRADTGHSPSIVDVAQISRFDPGRSQQWHPRAAPGADCHRLSIASTEPCRHEQTPAKACRPFFSATHEALNRMRRATCATKSLCRRVHITLPRPALCPSSCNLHAVRVG